MSPPDFRPLGGTRTPQMSNAWGGNRGCPPHFFRGDFELAKPGRLGGTRFWPVPPPKFGGDKGCPPQNIDEIWGGQGVG